MRLVSSFPRKVRVIEHCWIPMRDGVRLAARIWLPEDAERDPVPAILEYIPYRKRDVCRASDAAMHAYFAGHGYAAVRVDLRGSGDSEGILNDEYLPQEQEDGEAVIAWLAAQPWCTGVVGMMGISWGGFNSLQIAARRPPALKAIITVGSTDDRYATDIHYCGGCLTKDNVDWAAVMLSHLSTPPDPEIVGARWRAMWMERLEHLRPWLIPWVEHQRRDAYWRQGSVCEDYSRIQIPVYAVNGWADNYAQSIPRLLAGLSGPRKGLIGPWAHNYPQAGKPEPAIGFLQEALRWWDQWLKGKETGITDEPMYRVWMQESVPPAAFYPERRGRWVAEEVWPSPRIQSKRYVLNPGRLDAAAQPETPLSLSSLLTTGLSAGELGRYGEGAEHPTDQREDDGSSLVFLSDPLTERMEILGGPVVELDLLSDRPQAMLSVRLNEVAPDGKSTRVTYGLLNLSHRESHENPQPLVPGQRYRIRIALDHIAHAFSPGHRLAVSISNAYWPLAWPSPETARLTVYAGSGTLELPVRPPSPIDDALPAFAEPECAPPSPTTRLRAARENNRVIHRDIAKGETTVTLPRDSGCERLDDIDLVIEEHGEVSYRIIDGSPLSAEAETQFAMRRERGDWRVSTETRTQLTADRERFCFEATLHAYEDDREVFSRSWRVDVPRDML